jgi:hypothetical protein
MFKWLNKQGVESNKGFIVQVVSRFVIEYSQYSKKISVPIEIDYGAGGNVVVIVHKPSFEHWDDGDILLPEKKSEIMLNFKGAMEFQGITVIIDD